MGTPISTAKGNMAYDSKYSKFTYGAPTIEPSQPSTPSTNATVEMNTLTKKTIDRMSDMASVIPAANASVALSYVHPSSLSVVVVVKVSSRGPEEEEIDARLLLFSSVVGGVSNRSAGCMIFAIRIAAGADTTLAAIKSI